MLLAEEMEYIKSRIPHYEVKAESVSKATTGWQLDHSMRVLCGVVGALKYSEPKEYKWKFSLPRTYVFMRGGIPRGAGRVPKEVKKSEEPISVESLQEMYEKSMKRLKELEQFSSNQFFKHPLFGDLKLKKSKRFIEIHTRHHILIVRDIEKAAGQ